MYLIIYWKPLIGQVLYQVLGHNVSKAETLSSWFSLLVGEVAVKLKPVKCGKNCPKQEMRKTVDYGSSAAFRACPVAGKKLPFPVVMPPRAAD